ncbi:MAG: T9SS type A sorting domain-containing protein [candidate division Zixibacteria bacterium]|nr:T9SS type A sorting domain-containing protein [candidate division Zixibacteria bacterium]MDH3937863.1 T9SS type A sorting domain-containing protein [candidate division Zixibacteria bacterium]MDH4033331.1 T9SS type A sorting domain-containing protein [candidate division Zixibacteria bacterium]
MRFKKIPAIVLLLFLAFAGSASAQVGVYTCINSYIDCGQISNSSVDQVAIQDFAGRPGDTVWMPVHLNTNDTVSGFLILVEFDSAQLTPVHYPLDPQYPDDTLFVQYQLAGALQLAQDQQDIIDPNKEVFFAQISTQSADSGFPTIICAFNLGFGGGIDSTQTPPRMNPTTDFIFRLPFLANPSMPDGDSANFSYREVNEFVVTSEALLEAFCADCRRTNMSVDRDCEVEVYDTLATVPQLIVDTLLDTVTCTSVLYPTTLPGQFFADATPPPEIQSFASTAPGDSVGTGDGFVLTWTVVNADSIFITGPSVDYATTILSDFLSVNAPATQGSFTYTLTAINATDTSTAVRTMLVKNPDDDPPDDPHQPVINVNTSHFIDVGNTLVFTVSATDPDGDFVTLEATDLPTNATFPTVTGTGLASGTFTFTPTLNQAGTETATFRASDGNTSPTTVTVQINIAEPAFDKLFTSSTDKSASGGIPGVPSFLFPVNLVTSQTVYGVQFDFLFDEANFNVRNVLTNHNTAEYVIYSNEDDSPTPGEVRVITFGMANEPIGTDGTEVLLIEMEVESGALPGQYPVYFNYAWESVNPDPNFPSLPLIADTGVVQVDMFGDVNLNLNVDVADLVSIVGHIIAAYTLNQRQIDAGDVNFDASVNVFDLVAIVNSILSGVPLEGSPSLLYEDQYAKVQLDFDDLQQGESDLIVVRSDLPTDIAGVELEILYDPATVYLGRPEQGEDATTMSINSSNNGGGKLKVLLHSGNPFAAGGSINSGEVELVTIPITTNEAVARGDTTQIKLSQALLSTSSATAVRVEGLDAPLPTSFRVAQNYPNPFNPSTTIEFSFGPIGKKVRLEIFNIIGQKVTTLVDDFLSPRDYSVEWNSTDDNGQKVASGVYLYKLQVGTESQTKKMLLLK